MPLQPLCPVSDFILYFHIESRYFITEDPGHLQDMASRDDLHRLLTEDGAWEAFVSKTKLPRSPLWDAPALPPNPCMTGSLWAGTAIPDSPRRWGLGHSPTILGNCPNMISLGSSCSRLRGHGAHRGKGHFDFEISGL